MVGVAPFLYNKLNLGGSIQGIDTLQAMVDANLAEIDPSAVLQPLLAEDIPSLANGQWKLFPDGRMETTWKLRANVFWHDGTPFTSDDVVFTAQLAQDRELPQFRNAIIQQFVETVEATDPHTVVVKWKSPYYQGDRPFDAPLPAHILRERSASKADFVNLPFWREEFVGTGAFKVRAFDPGNLVILEAFDGYFQGRPKIDTIEVKFIPDPNTLLANLLAGEVELTIGRAALSTDQAQDLRVRWSGGRVETKSSYLMAMFAQTRNPTPAALADKRFRQALLYAIDRQTIVDTIYLGMTPVSRAWMDPDDPQYRDVENRTPTYAHDPRRAAQLIESMGYMKGSDGVYATASGERLSPVELRGSASYSNWVKVLEAVVDQWKQAGVPGETLTVTAAQNQDREFRATRPGFVLTSGQFPGSGRNFDAFPSREIPTPENGWLGNNMSQWTNPQYDDLLTRYERTIPRDERLPLLGEILRLIADEVPAYPLFYEIDATAMANRITGVTPYKTGMPGWNNHLWDVRS
jgi:peptide/nickel transport system substrate-binding protein